MFAVFFSFFFIYVYRAKVANSKSSSTLRNVEKQHAPFKRSVNIKCEFVFFAVRVGFLSLILIIILFLCFPLSIQDEPFNLTPIPYLRDELLLLNGDSVEVS